MLAEPQNFSLGASVKMQLANLLSIISSIFSIQVGIFMLSLHIAVARRVIYLVFSLLCMALGATAFCSFMSTVGKEAYTVLFWFRCEHALHFLTAGLFAHFVVLFLNQPYSASVIRLVHLTCATFALLAFTPAFLNPSDVNALQVRPGPLYTSMLFSFVLWLTPAWMFMRKLRREEATGVEGSGDVASQLWVSSETAEEAMRNELRLMLIGSIAVVALCWLDFGIAMTSSIKPLRLHPLGILLLSLLGGIIVGRRVILSELQVRELETLLKAREAAADDVAHEMKTPLTVIKGYALTLLRMSPEEIDSSLLQDSLTAIADEAERLTRMINNMLDIARLEAGKPVTLRVQDVNLKTMLLQLIERMQRLTDKHNLKLQWHASREEFTIDADKVYQVVLNLVDNAIKYSPSGGDVVVKVEEEEDLLRISVIDQGIGMTKEQQEKLFRRLERVVDPKRKIMGTGIGLYLMKKLVEAMGGEMGVQSEPQKGSTFWFTIPKVMKH